MPGQFFYGDAHDVIPRFIRDNSIGLVYCDPPWSPSREHNHFWLGSEAQGQAYQETWTYASRRAMIEYEALRSQHRLAAQLGAWHQAAMGPSPTMTPAEFAYLTFMATRLLDIERKMRVGASIVLHCDDGMERHLGELCDLIFPWGFVGSVGWQRHSAHNDARRYGKVTDRLLWYCKGNGRVVPRWTFNNSEARVAYTDEERGQFTMTDNSARGGFRTNSYHAPSHGRPTEARRFRGGRIVAPPEGRMWPAQATVDRDDGEDRIFYGVDGNAIPRIKEYLNEMPGRLLQDTWTDLIPPAVSNEREHATSKPVALLRRVVAIHSAVDDLILDPFCGGGTTLQAAQALGRRWIGIDVAYEAINAIRQRTRIVEESHNFQALLNGEEAEEFCSVTGFPADMRGAIHLMDTNAMMFQWWSVDKCGGRPLGGRPREMTPRPDRGVDGEILLDKGRVLLQAAVGAGPAKLRETCHVRDRDGYRSAILLCRHATSGMREEAAHQGLVEGTRCPRLQILTPEDMLTVEWRGPELPGINITPPTPWV